MAATSIIVPLYIYPLEKAWEPLILAAKAHTNLQFLVIINPNSGPGPEPLPDASYLAAVKQLNQAPNIRCLGYVHCTYGQREMGDVLKDINTYRGWSPTLKVEGIFIDETPSDTALVSYLATIAEHVHTSWTSKLGRESIVIYNPGVVVDPAFFDAADYVVTFEQSQQHWKLLHSSLEASHHLPDDILAKTLAIIHSFPHTDSELDNSVADARSKGFAGLYITDQEGGGFTHWPAAWHRFVMACCGSEARLQDG